MNGQVANIARCRASEMEHARTEDLMRLVPKNRISVLDVGARDGHFSRLLLQHFREVTALDLVKPSFGQPGIREVAGDVTALEFPDNAFDCVFCAEVFEHVPALERACREIFRVAKHEIVIGVPFRQDNRIGRTTCRSCGGHNPPYGHVNTFDEQRLRTLFNGANVKAVSFVGTNRERTHKVATMLMDAAGNPWGTYTQDETCIHCGAKLVPPPSSRTFWKRACAGVAVRLTQVQTARTEPHGNWIHIAFEKNALR